MKPSYDLLVPFYDTIVKLIYGNALRNAQVKYLALIPPSSRILIIGGGTGWILDEIAQIHPHNLCIDYVDISSKMIAKAKKQYAGNNRVHFINQSIFDWQTDDSYEVVITPFFFDNFSEANAAKAFAILHSHLKENGLWLYTDFQIAHQKAHWQKALLFLMYAFFRMAANIEAKRLPDIVSRFNFHQYQLLKTHTFFHRFIITTVYKKADGS